MAPNFFRVLPKVNEGTLVTPVGNRVKGQFLESETDIKVRDTLWELHAYFAYIFDFQVGKMDFGHAEQNCTLLVHMTCCSYSILLLPGRHEIGGDLGDPG